MSKNDPAFPVVGPQSSRGLTKLEWFAGMAMQVNFNTDHWGSCESLAQLSFDIAEAMLAESEKRKGL